MILLLNGHFGLNLGNLSVYIKRIQKVSYYFFPVKNTPKLINQQLKNEAKIVNWKKKKLVITFFIVKNTHKLIN